MVAITITQITPYELKEIIKSSVLEVLKQLDEFKKQPVPDRWFDLNELCEYHPDKPKKPTVYGWVNAGTIPVHKGAKKLRFLKSEIDNWLLSK